MATKFYLPSSGAPSVSPAYDAAWEDTSVAARLKLVTAKSMTAMAEVSITDTNADDKDILFRQYVSEPLDGGQSISAQVIQCVARAWQSNNKNNMYQAFGVRVFSEDGLTLRSTLLAVTRDNVELQIVARSRINNPSCSAYSAANGDRIVIEIGVGGDPAVGQRHNSLMDIGDNQTNDLDATDVDEDNDNPWINFVTDTLDFEGGPPPPDPADEKLRVVRSGLVWA